MAKNPEFSEETKRLLASRAGQICNNPRCSTLTVGPADGSGLLVLKIGEAAHIKAAKADQARYDPAMTDTDRANITNGIWLCANCHTMIDKNQGLDFPVHVLEQWKKNHENIIRSLLHTHKSPLPLLRQFTEEGKIAQQAIDCMEDHAALYEDKHNEVDSSIILSFDRLRDELTNLIAKIQYDSELKIILKKIREHIRIYMNNTDVHTKQQWSELKTARYKIGIQVGRLREEYGCKVLGRLNEITP